MDLDKRLENAIARGQNTGARAAADKAAEQLTQAEIKRKHNDLRIQLSEHIEKALKRLADHFPGFQYESVYGEKGWGGALFRDDIGPGGDGRSATYFSRIDVVLRPLTEFAVLDLFAKGTIKNKELFTRNFYREIQAADENEFQELIDTWVVEYAEHFAAANS